MFVQLDPSHFVGLTPSSHSMDGKASPTWPLSGFRSEHAMSRRDAFGRSRVRSMTWLGGEPEVEGVEADDYTNGQMRYRLHFSGNAWRGFRHTCPEVTGFR